MPLHKLQVRHWRSAGFGRRMYEADRPAYWRVADAAGAARLITISPDLPQPRVENWVAKGIRRHRQKERLAGHNRDTVCRPFQ
jgi:hypothetical protein